jgi:hypothetical protein
MRWLGALLLVVLLLVSSGALPLARFTAETIAIDIEGDRIHVDGTYFYENPFPFPIRQGMSVPFPPGFEPVGVSLSLNGKPLPLRRIFGTERFEIPLPAFATARVRLLYEEYTPLHRATYLLTTTAPWHCAIDDGVYTIHANGARINHSSYPLNAQNMFRRRDFMPGTDWSFAWE